jgi:tripartite-type tricarboxylate transporter receptor subunit TctC
MCPPSPTAARVQGSGIGLLVAPARTPAEIVQRLNRAIDPIVKEPKALDYLLSLRLDQFRRRENDPGAGGIHAPSERWNDVVQKGEIRAAITERSRQKR